MRSSRVIATSIAATGTLLLSLGLTACSPGSGTEQASNTETTQPGAAAEDAATRDSEGNDDRAFNSTDDAVIIAVETAMKAQNAKAEWSGSTLRVSLDGSADDPTAGLFCSTLDAVLADSESGVFVYADGEIPCE